MEYKLFTTPKEKTSTKVIMGVYKYVNEEPHLTSEMCIHIGKRQTLWFGRDSNEFSIYGLLEHGTSFNDLEYVPSLVFGVALSTHLKDSFDKPIQGAVWYFKSNVNNKVVMYGKALKPLNMLNEIKKLKHNLTGL